MYVENFDKANIFGGRSDDGFHKNSTKHILSMILVFCAINCIFYLIFQTCISTLKKAMYVENFDKANIFVWRSDDNGFNNSKMCGLTFCST